MTRLLLIALPLVLAGCGTGFFNPGANAPRTDVAAPAPQPSAVLRKPPESARTADQFDATTAQERAAAARSTAPAGERSLGTTVASLGDPSRVGFWIETPLVGAPGKGRVVYSGKSANVDLIPIDGPKTAGSRLSLSAMRLIEAPLTALPTVEVYAGS